MYIPLTDDVQKVVEEVAQCISLKELLHAAKRLSFLYRPSENKKVGVDTALKTKEERVAYLVCRFPATYAAISAVFNELKRRICDLHLESILDLGAGPGTVLWGVCDLWPSLKKVTLVEHNSGLIELGKEVIRRTKISFPFSLDWLEREISFSFQEEVHDAVVASYILGELSGSFFADFVERGWQLCQKVFVLIEPGTPEGYKRILRAREILIKKGAKIVAPCPHSFSCPLSEEDWCHFSVRIPRTFFHKKAKEGTLPYEDEKYSYLIVSKEDKKDYKARVLSPVFKRSNRVFLRLCTESKEIEKVIRRKEKEAYQKARKLEWGDIL